MKSDRNFTRVWTYTALTVEDSWLVFRLPTRIGGEDRASLAVGEFLFPAHRFEHQVLPSLLIRSPALRRQGSEKVGGVLIQLLNGSQTGFENILQTTQVNHELNK